MKFVLVIASVCLVLVTANQQDFENFKIQHGKVYRSSVEQRLRYQIYLNNLQEIEEHNARYEKGLTTYKKAVNQFADMTKEEFLAFLKLSGTAPKVKATELFQSRKAAPSSIDWRATGAVTPVKNQKSCGSCWSFSATGSLEGQNQIKNGKLVSLSEQNLVDCSSSYGNAGCNGGLMDLAFEYVRDHGINSEADYPYEGVNGKCRFDSSNIVLKATGYGKIKKDDEDDLIEAIGTIGPISVAIDATSFLQFYSSGIFTDSTCSKHSLNHGVLAVGYTEDTIIVKNSWASSWGESGYVRFKRGSNLCGIATDASYPLL
ncbi:procathepsin L [Aethina tumida]|uniref:procathepsin L n=1 Tax=Aethina tumida TaxID=116153 RepID=UPI00096ADCFC|nr:procathepsin L [Aethina tumida]